MKLTPESRPQWIHFAVSAATMLALAGFTIWRAAVTAWRPTANRFYFFPNKTWLGAIDHHCLGDWLKRVDRSWFNDFLLGPGTVACFFVAFTLLYAAGGLLGAESGTLFNSNRSAGSDASFSDHKRLMQVILYGLLVRALIAGWGEEVGVFNSFFIFDPWDLTVELGGIVLGAWFVHMLSYPLIAKPPHFSSPEPCLAGLRGLTARFSIDVMSVIATGFYICIVDPFELRPLTLLERQTLSAEIALVFLTFRAGLKRGMNPSSDSFLPVLKLREHMLSELRV